jgi:hypothetical protein
LSTPQLEDPLPDLAARFYGTHSAILQLDKKAPNYLINDLHILGSKIEVAGGSIIESTNVFGEKGPVVLDRTRSPFSYESGSAISYSLIDNFLNGPGRQA